MDFETQEDQDRIRFQETMGFEKDMYAHLNSPDHTTIPTRRPPASKQLQTAWLLNNEGPDSNYIQNTGAAGDAYRVTETSEVDYTTYEDQYFKLFMSEKNPFRIAEILKQKVSSNVLQATQETWKTLSAERGLIGDFYVDLTPFKDCDKDAAPFVQQHCASAKFIKKLSACSGCGYREKHTCTLMKKTLTDEVPYTPRIAKALVANYVKARKLTPAQAGKVHAQATPKKQIQTAIMLANANKLSNASMTPEKMEKYNVVKEATPLTPENVNKHDTKIVNAAIEKAIKKGATAATIIRQIGKHTGTSYVTENLYKIASNIQPLNAVKFAQCSDKLAGNVSLLMKDAQCGDCVFHEASANRCTKLRANFIKQTEDEIATQLSSKVANTQLVSEQYMVDFFSRAIDAGVSYVQLKEAFHNRMVPQNFSSFMGKAVKKASKLSPATFTKCKGAFYQKVAKVYRNDDCITCPQNKLSHCAQLKKPFVNPELDQGNSQFNVNAMAEDKGQQMFAADVIPAKEVRFERPISPNGQVAKQLISAGLSKNEIVQKFASEGLTGKDISLALTEALDKRTNFNTFVWDACNRKSALVQKTASLKKVSKCMSCRDHRGHKCSRYNKPFEASDLDKQHSSINAPVDNGQGMFMKENGQVNAKVSEMVISFDD